MLHYQTVSSQSSGGYSYYCSNWEPVNEDVTTPDYFAAGSALALNYDNARPDICFSDERAEIPLDQERLLLSQVGNEQ